MSKEIKSNEYLIRVRSTQAEPLTRQGLLAYLKRLGRNYGLTCVSIRPVQPVELETSPGLEQP